MGIRLRLAIPAGALVVALAPVCSHPALGQGLVLTGVGAVNRSMGGAATAAPVDPIGALHWNPATMGAFKRHEMAFGVELLSIPTELSSTLPAGAFGPVPTATLSGSDRGETGVFPLPSFGLVAGGDRRWTFGLGVFTIGGFGVNYAASGANPILTPQPPNGFGVGSLYSRLQVLQIAAGAAVRVNEHLSLGIAPTVSLVELTANPATIAAPDDANGDGFPSYPPGLQSRFHWGGGLQAGVFQTTEAGFDFGASIKSPQWFETLSIRSHDERGRDREVRFDFQYPMIVSLGAAFHGREGRERLIVAADVRYIDYENADGFQAARYGPDGAVTGLGWKSVWGVNLGAQRKVKHDRVSLRLGYSFSENPIPDEVTTFNLASPSITRHIIYPGVGVSVTEALSVALTYIHAFANSIEGPLVLPTGPVAGTAVGTEISVNAVGLSLSAHF